MVEKLKALAQWFVPLERAEHRHWCVRDRTESCRHQFYAWRCRGIFCAGRELWNCPACRRGEPCQCQDCRQARARPRPQPCQCQNCRQARARAAGADPESAAHGA